MKKVWSSIFQTVSESVKTLSENANKKARHDVVLMTTGISVVTMLTFTAGDLSGSGQHAMVAYAETPVQTVVAETELEEANFEEISDLLIGEEHSKEETTLLLLERETEDVSVEEVKETSETGEAVEDEEHTTEDETAESVAQTEDKESEPVKEEQEPEAVTETAEEKASEEVVLNNDEYHVLLRIVQAEAGTCDENGKLLVANVILNRVESEEFPDTVREVVYQKRQFSPVMNGTINTCKITMETRNAVNRALKGEDLSEGALYFMNRGKSASRNVRWFDANLEYLFKHGDHEFFR